MNRINPEIVKSSKGLRKAFFCGSNTSCRQHIRQHYTIYQQRCLEQSIAENYRAIPTHILKEREAAKKPTKQTKLDGIILKEARPADFSKERILEAVAKLIACDDQVNQIKISRKDVA
jgi:hypothetical protein